jgi:O-antigen/teichoic acid export membrane protein
VSAVAGAAAAIRRPRVFVGAWLLSATTVAAGLLTYAFLVLAARTLGPHAYGRVAALWGAIFIGAVVLFRPLEQTASRTIADRLARGHDARSVLRALAIVGMVAVSVATAVVFAAWRPLTSRVFLGDPTLTLLLLAGTVAYGMAYLVRGVVGGVRWFGGYGLVLVADGLARLAVAAPLVLVASEHLAGAAMVAAGAAGAIVPFVFGRTRLRAALVTRGSQAFDVRSAFAFAAPATLIAVADQLLVNGAPLLVIVDGGAHAAKSAGVVFAATMLVRAPIYVFTGLAASILPNLTTLAAGGDRARFRAAVIRGSLSLMAAGIALVALVALGGTRAMRGLYGHSYAAGLGPLVLLAIGAACYLAAGTASQGLLALDRGRAAAAAWIAGAVAFVTLFVVLPGSELGRVSLAFALAMAACTVLVGIAVAREARGG